MQLLSKSLREKIFSIGSDADFNEVALEIFEYQKKNVGAYNDFLKFLGPSHSSVNHFSEIPCLPVTAFKTHQVTDQKQAPEFYFQSSGTTGMERSRHYICDLSLYEESFMRGFRHFYGDPGKYVFLALLPSYLEQGRSSLVYMADKLIRESGDNDSGFYLNNYEELRDKIEKLRSGNKRIFLLGVTYALLDFLINHPCNLTGHIVMETGGMKGRKREMIRDEVHAILKKNSGADTVHSEYGMTELLSQAYSSAEGLFRCPPWMKILIRDSHDPFTNVLTGETGSVHVIDLANFHSCSFIGTQDLGRYNSAGTFEILGRMDYSELRGCSLMVV